MANKPIEWHTEKRRLSKLKPMGDNPRRTTKRQILDLTKSLNKFNLAAPLIINCDNTIIGGHFRYKILKRGKNDKEVDVRVPNRELTQEEVEELNLRLNKNLGEWDWNLLGDFDTDILKDVGFNRGEIDKIFSDDGNGDGEIEFTKELLEENNYIVFVFDNVLDWQNIMDIFQIKQVQSSDSKSGYRKIGIGRVIDGKKLMERL